MNSYHYESNDYTKVKNKFEYSSRVGYKYIAYWVVSQCFYETYQSDEAKSNIKRVSINSQPYIDNQDILLGYEIAVSNNFNALYGIYPVFNEDCEG